MIASQSLPPLGFGYAPLAGSGIKLDETYPLIGCLHIPITRQAKLALRFGLGAIEPNIIKLRMIR